MNNKEEDAKLAKAVDMLSPKCPSCGEIAIMILWSCGCKTVVYGVHKESCERKDCFKQQEVHCSNPNKDRPDWH
ncbi:MAG: hypothetical protein COX39_02485 [Candidatus Nealsonbacteria bacterium CG23_combo_of_CG06-09_8_20_14_all_40_13]|uniref:Uncharacterized protein n=1 Tax=Candidatus Nealsonbacteria bacterium CG23_combo_of_CG06-09_8_20_14_all_40_13 TaxID=1974724 RepID=A0A2G9YST0_9BACT|nr:MAG: hypothetical protein COX39_02485 [Candidatus Nealsonbacteria bacterium CG23_combo_of_CG06-09_8_20_14_all_40_13]PIR71070.1 MAG: hypothetical protein COU44_01515 [Candidatus Nealsonbacteria bacterium CG10_big_fil_rev_8_21_14_0_10_40_24]